MAGFRNDIMYANNVDFTGNAVIAAQVTLNGQLLIGSTVAPNIRVGTLTAGAGITITNGAGTITIAASGAGAFVWQTITASQTLVKFNGYIGISPGGALALALPSTGSSTIGDIIEIALDGATSFSITQAAGQQIRFSGSQTTIGVTGSVTSTGTGDSVRMAYEAAGKWIILSANGNLTIT